MVLSVNANCTKEFSGINFPIAHICYTKELFPNYLGNHFGPYSTPISVSRGADREEESEAKSGGGFSIWKIEKGGGFPRRGGGVGHTGFGRVSAEGRGAK